MNNTNERSAQDSPHSGGEPIRLPVAAGYAVGGFRGLTLAISRLNQCREAARRRGFVIPEQFEFFDFASDAGRPMRSGWRCMWREFNKGRFSVVFVFEPSPDTAYSFSRRRAQRMLSMKRGIEFVHIAPLRSAWELEFERDREEFGEFD